MKLLCATHTAQNGIKSPAHK